uniref:B30.2/SPRY domain-containing protein n=1 Tax=Salvator merianae TaxID=96440 RepID=A0A8D0BIU3_SALMN
MVPACRQLSRKVLPILEVSQNGKSVWDTGEDQRVSESEDRFDSHTFILAKEGFSEGKHYWQVDVGQKKRWDLGIASESAHRKKEITLSPQNGYWVIGYDDGIDYWARTEEWTHLGVSGKLKLTKIGIFLNVSARTLTFYNVLTKRKLHTYTTVGPGKLYPFFSTGSITKELDKEQLTIESCKEVEDK